MDHISPSCSLLNILSYIDHKDIPNAQLVSRRFHHLITNNAFHLPRPRAYLRIATVPMKTVIQLRDFISIDYGIVILKGKLSLESYRRRTILITDERIRVYKGTLMELAAYLDENGVSNVGPIDSEETEFFQRIEGGCEIPWLTGREREEKDYVSGGIENGLRLVLPFILRQYHFDNLLIHNEYYVANSREAEWLSGIGQMARHCRTYSVDLYFLRAWSGMGALSKAFGCRNVTAEWESNESFSDFLGKLDMFDRHFTMKMEVKYIDSLPAVVDFIKRWAAGRSRLPLFQLYTDSFGPDLKFPHGDFMSAIESNFRVLYSKVNNPATDKIKHVEIVIGRPADQVVLCLGYSRYRSEIIMVDTPWTGQLPDVRHYLKLE